MNPEHELNVTPPPYPIIYCDENLTVADVGPSLAAIDFHDLQGKSLKKHLSQKDMSALLSCLYKDFSQKRPSIFVDLENLRGAKCAHVTVTKLFGRTFFEMRLFKNRITMFKDFNVSSITLSHIPYIPNYSIEKDRVSINETRDKLEKFFSAGYLRNLYYSAIDPFKPKSRWEAADVTKHIISTLSYSLDLKGTKFPLTTEKTEDFGYCIIDVSNYINLVALLMKICHAVSASGQIETTLKMNKDKVSLLFVTDAKKSDTEFLGGFAFPFLSEMYPSIGTFVWAAKYISEIFGLRCYAELSGKNTLAIELLMRPVPPDMDIGVMHPDTEHLEELLECARILLDRLAIALFPEEV